MSQTFKKVTKKVIKERYGINKSISPLFEKGSGHHLNGFDHPTVIVIANDAPSSFQTFDWGLIPFWVNDIGHAKQMENRTLNAKCETVFELPSFREAILKRRCIIPVDGFFEWLHHRNKTYPHYIYPKDETVFSLGGIWEQWSDQSTGRMKRTFSIITTAANDMMDKIHNSKKRMPLILNPETEMDWLSQDLSNTDISLLMQPFKAESMAYHTVSRLVTSRKENSDVPEVKEPLNYQELSKGLF
ncbi:SOS response-associated peptidase [Anditalea andensis]|nr:SOS response-associated peptidase [Anditalea andensis]